MLLFKLRIKLAIIFATALLLLPITEVTAGPSIRQGILGHLSMSVSRCVEIAREICQHELGDCIDSDDGAVASQETFTIGLQCARLEYNQTFLVIFGAVNKDGNENRFNDLFVRSYNRAAPFFRR